MHSISRVIIDFRSI
ncbi:uncharacterized protein FPRN_09926 [Fusarium proliferatum]|nr:uncharacterized protein FPRN_09926 [Fusarium proliferatum]